MSLIQLAFLASAMGTALSAIMTVAWQVQRHRSYGLGSTSAGPSEPASSQHSAASRHFRQITRQASGRSWSLFGRCAWVHISWCVPVKLATIRGTGN